MEPILERLRAEFLEMPGLRLTAQQVHRFCGVDRDTCRAVLDVLVREQFLCVKQDGTYVRLTEGHPFRRRAVKADLRHAGDLQRQAS